MVLVPFDMNFEEHLSQKLATEVRDDMRFYLLLSSAVTQTPFHCLISSYLLFPNVQQQDELPSRHSSNKYVYQLKCSFQDFNTHKYCNLVLQLSVNPSSSTGKTIETTISFMT